MLKKIFGREVRTKKFNVEPKQNVKTEMEKFERISAILGRDVNAESVLTAEDLQLIEENSTPAPPAEQAEENGQEQMAEQIAQAVNAGMAPIQSTLASIESRLAIVEKRPGAEATATAPTQGNEKTEVPSWEDPNRSYNQLVP